MISKKKVGVLVLAGIFATSNYMWYNHTKDLETKLESRSQAIETLDTSIKKQGEYVQELKIQLQERNDEIHSLRGEIAKAQEMSYRTREVELTFYAPTGELTASGTVPQAGRTIACNFLSFGTHVLINGHEYIVEDTGGALGNSVIDIFVNSEEEALQLGRQKAIIQILN